MNAASGEITWIVFSQTGTRHVSVKNQARDVVQAEDVILHEA